MTPSVSRCPTCHRRHVRSHPQNARMWVLLHLIADNVKPGGKTYSADQFHWFFKSRFLGCDDIQMPNGKVTSIPRSTAGLDVAEFGDYLTQIEAWAAEREIYLEDLTL